MRNFVLFGIISLFLITCISCKTSKNSYADRTDLLSLVASKEFEIENNWALPLRGAQINLITNDNHLRFSNDSIIIFLPYFGVRQFSGGYNAEAGIRYSGLVEELQVDSSFKDKVELRFETNTGTEQIRYILSMYPNGNTNLQLMTNQRDNISYRGFYRESKYQ